jgi:hypothetical protein
MTRKEAKLQGLKLYLTGKACCRGHISERYVSCGMCVECNDDHNISWKSSHKKEISVSRKKYRETHKVEISSYDRVYRNNRRENDVLFRILTSLRSRLNIAVRKDYKSGSAVSDLGCSIEQFKIHLESKFYNGMTWENQGSYWHIDHIKPLASFDLSNREQFLEACHYTNMQPLTVIDNLNKGGKLDWKKKSC